MATVLSKLEYDIKIELARHNAKISQLTYELVEELLRSPITFDPSEVTTEKACWINCKNDYSIRINELTPCWVYRSSDTMLTIVNPGHTEKLRKMLKEAEDEDSSETERED